MVKYTLSMVTKMDPVQKLLIKLISDIFCRIKQAQINRCQGLNYVLSSDTIPLFRTFTCRGKILIFGTAKVIQLVFKLFQLSFFFVPCLQQLQTPCRVSELRMLYLMDMLCMYMFIVYVLFTLGWIIGSIGQHTLISDTLS